MIWEIIAVVAISAVATLVGAFAYAAVEDKHVAPFVMFIVMLLAMGSSDLVLDIVQKPKEEPLTKEVIREWLIENDNVWETLADEYDDLPGRQQKLAYNYFADNPLEAERFVVNYLENDPDFLRYHQDYLFNFIDENRFVVDWVYEMFLPRNSY